MLCMALLYEMTSECSIWLCSVFYFNFWEDLQKKLYHNLSTEETLKNLSSDSENGLSGEEALSRHGKYGFNKLSEKKKKTTLQRFIDQFKDVMILILIAAAVVSFVVVCVLNIPL